MAGHSGGRFALIGLIILVSGIWTLIISVSEVMESRQGAESKEWPITTGVVITSEIEEYRSTSGSAPNVMPSATMYQLHVSYVYTIDGVDYGSDRIRHGSREYRDRSTVEYDPGKYPIGGPVEVHYDPDNPRNAVLEAGTSGVIVPVMVLGCVFGSLLSLAGLYLLVTFGGLGNGSRNKRRYQSTTFLMKRGQKPGRPNQ
jgi:hypothetical protein